MNSKQSDYASLSEYALPSAYQDTILVKEILNGLQCEPIPDEFAINSESKVLSNGCKIGNVYG